MNNQNAWRYIDNAENLAAMPNDRDFEVLFDDTTILKFSCDNFPIAEIVTWRELKNSTYGKF